MPSTVLGWLISNIEPRPTSVRVNYVHSFISGRYKQITWSRYAQHMQYIYICIWCCGKCTTNSKKGQLDMFCYELRLKRNLFLLGGELVRSANNNTGLISISTFTINLIKICKKYGQTPPGIYARLKVIWILEYKSTIIIKSVLTLESLSSDSWAAASSQFCLNPRLWRSGSTWDVLLLKPVRWKREDLGMTSISDSE